MWYYAQLYKLWQTSSHYLDNISSVGRRHKVERQMIVAGKLEAFLSHLVVSWQKGNFDEAYA